MGWLKKIGEEVLFWRQCKRYGFGLWQCPNFLFLVMGGFTVLAMVVTYLIANVYADPFFVMASVALVAVVTLILGFIVVQSFEQLASASRMKTEFVSIASHQLRAPVSNMRWVLDFLLGGRAGGVSPAQKERLGILRENAKRMNALVTDLLNVSRIEQGRLRLKQEQVDLVKIARKLKKEFLPYAEANYVAIKIAVPDSLPEVRGDQKYVAMVLENLLDNAVRYIQGKGKVEIRFSQKQNKVRTEVEDNGVGIPKNEQKHIFQKFFRSRNVLHYQTEGTGLGLFISRAIVEALGGKMGFQSQEGKGSVFWFDLPVYK